MYIVLDLRHEGHEMKLKFMTPRQASKDQHRLKEKIEKERIEKEQLISLSLGDQITTTLATSVLPVCSEENS